MGHDTLANHILSNFNMAHHHKWSLTELENMLPWEKFTYVDLLNAHIQEEEAKAKDRENERKNMMNHLNRRRM
jgi:hypothetical protein